MLKSLKDINLNEAIMNLEKEFDFDNIIIKYWEDEDCREHGISSISITLASNIKETIYEARKMIDRDNIASVEVIYDNEDVLYFYDGEIEQVLAF